MIDERRSKEDLINELIRLRLRVEELEAPQNNMLDLEQKVEDHTMELNNSNEELRFDIAGAMSGISNVPPFEVVEIGGKRCILTRPADVTTPMQREEALLQSEEKLAKAFHGIPIMMNLCTVDEGKYLDCNEALCSLTGFTREELIGHTNKELNLIADYGKTMEHIAKLLKDGRLENAEVDIRTKSGDIINCLCWSQLLDLNGKLCHITGHIDITQQKRVEKETARLDRLKLIGEMAASIGHEIRNPMTSVRGFLQLLNEKECYREDETYFAIMIEELDRANQIISEYLNMAKDKVVSLQPRYLDALINSLYPMIQADANYKEIPVILKLGKPPMPLIDEKEICQMILNLTRNGLEAMSNGGILTIGTATEGNDIVLYVQDQGPGLAPDVEDKLGTPFVTTKDTATGLGLAICYSIAARHNARIGIETGSEGTKFKIYFPMPMEQIALF